MLKIPVIIYLWWKCNDIYKWKGKQNIARTKEIQNKTKLKFNDKIKLPTIKLIPS